MWECISLFVIINAILTSMYPVGENYFDHELMKTKSSEYFVCMLSGRILHKLAFDAIISVIFCFYVQKLLIVT